METEIEEESVNNYNYNEDQAQSRYLTQKKKQYLLASNTESIGLDKLASDMCASRNRLNLERLELETQIHKLELELIEFEKTRMLTR